jgi:hypothetical protein
VSARAGSSETRSRPSVITLESCPGRHLAQRYSAPITGRRAAGGDRRITTAQFGVSSDLQAGGATTWRRAKVRQTPSESICSRSQLGRSLDAGLPPAFAGSTTGPAEAEPCLRTALSTGRHARSGDGHAQADDVHRPSSPVATGAPPARCSPAVRAMTGLRPA